MLPTTSRPPARRSRSWGAAAAAGLLACLLVGCGSEGSDESPTTGTPSADAAALPDWAPEILTDGDDNVVGLDFTDTPEPTDELLTHLVTTGDGPEVESGQTITVDYLGEVYQGDEPFDASYSREPYTTPIGQEAVIAGWDQGLVGVPVGSRVLLSIPPELGYGAAGNGPIPGDSTLFFVVDVISAE